MNRSKFHSIFLIGRCQIIALAMAGMVHAESPISLSGIYPSLCAFNDEGECGIGAVVPWADRLWFITYAPHMPKGSSDKLYEITPDLKQILRKESIGGTPANRMIHKESNQLLIGPYAIDAKRQVRVIPWKQMFGRLTGNARHLFDPSHKLYYATMEEGIYEVDTETLAVKELWQDEQLKGGRHADLPGYHGKGLYSGQGRLIYANNGDHAAEALKNPAVPSGVLAEWDGKSDQWTMVRRNQFTEVTGPGGITGNPNPETDPVWSIGWDNRSLILMCLDDGKWHAYRVPKGSHSYDGAHGWNTEWPRIREIGEEEFLMTMHGTFWKFPKTFTSTHSAGIVPRSNYLKVIGDFCRWNDKVVMGCDDTAKAEFLNKNKAKGNIAETQSQSNLWFVDPTQLDHMGPIIGRGAVWMNEDVKADTPSDPYLLSGYERKGLHLACQPGRENALVTLEVDMKGDGVWTRYRDVPLGKSYQWIDLSGAKGTWMRLASNVDLKSAVAYFQYSNSDGRSNHPDKIFDGLASTSSTGVVPKQTGGLVRPLGDHKRTLAFAARDPDGRDIGYYELDAELKLQASGEVRLQDAKSKMEIPTGVLQRDAASIIYVDDHGNRWRLPDNRKSASQGALDEQRVCREVATERNLFHAGGTFYELPADNAGGFIKARALSTSELLIQDFCSYRGLLIMSGVLNDTSGNPHIIRSTDGKTALWAGGIDDIWAMGKPRGDGGPWADTIVKAGEISDPYLMTGFDKKTLKLSVRVPATITVQVDVTGNGEWVDYQSFEVKDELSHEFPEAFGAYWVRFRCSSDNTASAQLRYR